jgi:peptidoglycan/xylan/chitin deacetylase (PgdA/CDA1 family)
MFHHVSNRADWGDLKPFVIQEATFLRFLDSIERAGRMTQTFSQSADSPRGRNIILTFDDCGKHLLDFVVPELIARKMQAVFFMPTAHLGKTNDWDVAEGRSAVELMDASDLQELHRLGMEIGGHSHRHVHLGRLDRHSLHQELALCQQTLTEIVGLPARAFAFPFGSIPENAQDVLTAQGFSFACAIFSPAQSAHQLRRFIVHDGDNTWSMMLKMNTLYRWYRAFTDERKPDSAWT